MAFQVNSNIAALNVYNNLGVHQAKSNASLARISSGLKAAGGGDVASQGTAATINQNLQGTQNAISQVQSALLRLQAADAAYGELIALGQKGLETVSRGADAGADFDAIEAATDAIDAGIASIIAASEFNGTALSAATAPSVGSATLTVTPTFTAAPAITAGDIGDATDAATEATAFGTYITGTVANRASNAGNIASLQNTLQVLNSVAANELAGIGQAQDTDIAKEMMNLTSANIMTEAATAMLAQAMQLPNSVLKLLQ
jgi:flagellin